MKSSNVFLKVIEIIRLRFHHGGHLHFFWGRWGEIIPPLPLYVTAKTGSRMSFIPVAAFERPGI